MRVVVAVLNSSSKQAAVAAGGARRQHHHHHHSLTRPSGFSTSTWICWPAALLAARAVTTETAWRARWEGDHAAEVRAAGAADRLVLPAKKVERLALTATMGRAATGRALTAATADAMAVSVEQERDFGVD